MKLKYIVMMCLISCGEVLSISPERNPQPTQRNNNPYLQEARNEWTILNTNALGNELSKTRKEFKNAINNTTIITNPTIKTANALMTSYTKLQNKHSKRMQKLFPMDMDQMLKMLDESKNKKKNEIDTMQPLSKETQEMDSILRLQGNIALTDALYKQTLLENAHLTLEQLGKPKPEDKDAIEALSPKDKVHYYKTLAQQSEVLTPQQKVNYLRDLEAHKKVAFENTHSFIADIPSYVSRQGEYDLGLDFLNQQIKTAQIKENKSEVTLLNQEKEKYKAAAEEEGINTKAYKPLLHTKKTSTTAQEITLQNNPLLESKDLKKRFHPSLIGGTLQRTQAAAKTKQPNTSQDGPSNALSID